MARAISEGSWSLNEDRVAPRGRFGTTGTANL